ncbi:ABC-2 type transport system permease protein [Bacteroidales bacterium WCE2004]|nr:ABC-2 type transport system permease protein [Bacteroidales bacterium WCE2004]
MNLKTIGIVIRREYFNKVRKKSFIWTTFLVPILIAGLTIGIMYAVINTKDKTKSIAVVDASGIVMPYMTDTETILFKEVTGVSVDSIKTNLSAMGYDGVLSVSAIDSTRSVSAEIFSSKPFGMEVNEAVTARINRAVEDYRIASYDIAGLDQILKDVKANVKLRSYTMDEDGKEKISEAGVYSILSMIMGIFLFMFITMFGSMVMSSVIEEKTSRVVEVLVSSVKSTELMFGKIIGVALVALTQFFLWIVLAGAIFTVGGGALMNKLGGDPTELVSSMGGAQADQMAALAASPELADSGIGTVISTLQNLPIGQIIGLFLIYFVFGYLLYASLFAAIGSAVESEGDTQQLQLPLTIPLMLAYIIALYAFKAPDSSIAFWGSLIPFTSPVVMISRLPFGVPTWELILSLALLVLTFVFCAWLSAKIYRVGILMFGKKSTWKDLWKWLKQK